MKIENDLPLHPHILPKTTQTVSKLSGAPQNAKCAKFMASLVELKVGQVDIWKPAGPK
jgi:hypothetical protein